MSSNSYRFIEFNVGLVFISTAAVLGRYITASSTFVTFMRCAIAAVCLWALSLALKKSLTFDWKVHGRTLILTSMLMAVHWTTYFYSLDYSNVSIAIMTLYTFPAMTAIIEPIWFKQKIPLTNVVLAILALVAVGIIAPPGEISTDVKIAVALGLFSALCYSIRNVWIQSLTEHYTSATIMTYQLGLMALLILPFLYFVPIDWTHLQWEGLIVLGVMTTALGHTLFMRGLSYYDATTASILACAIPIYGIALAYFVLGEVPSVRIYVGGLIILGVVVYKAIVARGDSDV